MQNLYKNKSSLNNNKKQFKLKIIQPNRKVLSLLHPTGFDAADQHTDAICQTALNRRNHARICALGCRLRNVYINDQNHIHILFWSLSLKMFERVSDIHRCQYRHRPHKDHPILFDTPTLNADTNALKQYFRTLFIRFW